MEVTPVLVSGGMGAALEWTDVSWTDAPSLKSLTLTDTSVQTYAGSLTSSGRGPLVCRHNITDPTLGGNSVVRSLWCDVNVDFQTAPTSMKEVRGLFGYVQQKATSQGANVKLTGLESDAYNYATDVSSVLAGYFGAYHFGSGAAPIITGVQGNANMYGGTAGQAAGVAAVFQFNSTGAVTNGHGFIGNLLVLNAAARVENLYGFRLKNLSNLGTVTNTYGVYVGDLTAGVQTNQPWSFYAADPNARSYFAGNTGFGSQSTPTVPLHVGGHGIISGDLEVGGSLKFGTHNGIGSETVTGFITITDSSGTPRKVAIVS